MVFEQLKQVIRAYQLAADANLGVGAAFVSVVIKAVATFMTFPWYTC